MVYSDTLKTQYHNRDLQTNNPIKLVNGIHSEIENLSN